MSAGELVGLALSAALAGGACGALLVACRYRAARRAALEERRIDAVVHWLDAHAQRCRASIAFVKAFRLLAVEPRDSAFFAERREAARLARRRWRRSRRAYSYAETAMKAWSRDPAAADAVTRAIPDDEEIQRFALRGTQQDADALIRRIDEAETRAIEWVREGLWASARPRHLWRSVVDWAEGMVARVVRSWDRPN